jgi:hypothetical protein
MSGRLPTVDSGAGPWEEGRPRAPKSLLPVPDGGPPVVEASPDAP